MSKPYDPIAALREAMEAVPALDEPLSAIVDESGVVVLLNEQGHPRAWMSQDTYAALQQHVEALKEGT